MGSEMCIRDSSGARRPVAEPGDARRRASAPREQFPRPAAPGSAGVLTLGRPGFATARFLTPPRALDASTRARDADKGLSKGLSKSLASGRRPIRARDDDKGLSKGRASGRRPSCARDDDKSLTARGACRTVSAPREQFPRRAAPRSARVLTLGRPGLAPARFLTPPRALDASTRAARDADEGLSKSRASGRRPIRARDDDEGLSKGRAGRTVSAARGQLPRPASPGSAGVLTLGRPGLAPASFLAPPRALDASTCARDADKGLSKSRASGRRPTRA